MSMKNMGGCGEFEEALAWSGKMGCGEPVG